MIKTIQISDKYFWGFKEEVDLKTYSSFEEIGEYMKIKLIEFLKINNLLNLVDIAKNLHLHNHRFNIYNEVFTTDDNIIYLCGSCH